MVQEFDLSKFESYSLDALGDTGIIQAFIVYSYKKFGTNEELLREADKLENYLLGSGFDGTYEQLEKIENFVNTQTKRYVCDVIEYFYSNDYKNHNLSFFDYSGYSISEQDDIGQLIFNLFDISDQETFIDFNSGNGEFIYNLKKDVAFYNIGNCHVIGYEQDVCSRITSKLALDLLYFSYRICNPFEDDESYFDENDLYNEWFDKGFIHASTEQYRRYAETQGSFSSKYDGRMSCEWICIQKLLENMADGGKMIALVGARALYNEADKKYKNELLEKGLIEGIIELHTGRNRKMFLIIFSHRNEGVKILDAIDIETENIYGAYKKAEGRNLFNESNWVPSSLNAKTNNLDYGVRLGDIAEIIQTTQYTDSHFKEFECELSTESNERENMKMKDGYYQYITANNIIQGCIIWDSLTLVKMDDANISRSLVKAGDILLTNKSSKVRTGVIDENHNFSYKTFAIGSMFIIRPNPDKINPIYLKAFLDSESGLNALRKIQKGTKVLTMTADDLSNIIVPCEPMQKQEVIANYCMDLMTQYFTLKQKITDVEDKINNLQTYIEQYLADIDWRE